MGRGARLAVAVPAVLALVSLVVSLAPWGLADWQHQSIRNDVRGWAGAGRAPNARAWEGARGVLEDAVRLAPGNPVLHEDLGRLHLTEPVLALSPRFANEHLLRAIDLRPTAPYAWIALLVARDRLGFKGAPLEKPLVAVWRLGPSERAMQVMVAELGLASWNALGPAGRAVVAEAFAWGMRRNPAEMLGISQRRGRLALACAHVQGDPRLAQSPWLKACAEARRAGMDPSRGRQE